MPEVKISAAVITFNEERNIGRCLEALQALVDEIVVLDSGSTDRTHDICLEHKVKWHSHPFDDYATQKNRAAALASHDIILSLDADEAPSAELSAAILSVKNDWRADAYLMDRLTQYCGTWVRHGGWYPDTKLRLYDRRKGEWTGRKIHESIAMQQEAVVSKLHGDLLHYSFYTIEQHMQTVNRFSTLKAEKMLEEGRSATWLAMLLSPGIKFLKHYLVQQGFRDGRAGFHIAINSGHGEYLRYAKLWEMKRKAK